MRALIYTGMSVSLMKEERYKSLRKKEWLRRPDIEISQVDGKPMKIRGMVRRPVRIGGLRSVHNFYVTSDLCGEVIWAEDWLYHHKVHVKFNPTIVIVDGIDAIGKHP